MNLKLLSICAASVLLCSCSFLTQETKDQTKESEEIVTENEHAAATGAQLKVEGDPCETLRGDEQDHCYQLQAWEQKDFTICKKIQGERFDHLIGNPPRDKCFTMLAERLCNPAICDYIQGGQHYFSPIECKQQLSVKCP